MYPNTCSVGLFSSAGRYPLPFSTPNSISKCADSSKLQMTWSGFRISKALVTFAMSPALNCFCFLMVTVTLLSKLSATLRKRTCFRFRIISATSSTTPSMVENSCNTPGILIPVMAYPSNEDNRILLSALPIVTPYPFSRGLNVKRPWKSSDFSITTFSGI